MDATTGPPMVTSLNNVSIQGTIPTSTLLFMEEFTWNSHSTLQSQQSKRGACFTLEGSEVGWDRRCVGVRAPAVRAVEGGGVRAGQQSAVHRAALSVTNVPTVCVTGLNG